MKTQQKHYRGHGTGTLIRQSTGLFLAKWCHNGQTFVRSTKTHDKEAALKKLDEFVRPYLEEDEIAVQQNILARIRTIEKRQENEQQKKISQTLLKDLFETYIQTQGGNTISDQTTVCYQSYVRQYVKWLNENFEKVTTIGQVTKEMNQKFLRHLEATRSTSTFNVYLVTLKKMFVTLLHNPSLWDFKSKPDNVVYERRALTPKELKSLLRHVSGNRDLNVLFHLGIYTGLRLSDCSLIKWKNIDLEHKLISIVPKKTTRFNRAVRIPIHPKLFTLLKSMYKRSTRMDDYVSETNAHNYKTKNASYILKEVFMACKINDGKNKLSFHTLRHTFVSMSANHNIPLPIVQAIVGHSCITMTQRYYHLDATIALNALSKISF